MKRVFYISVLFVLKLIASAQSPFSLVRANIEHGDFTRASEIVDSCAGRNYAPDSVLLYKGVISLKQEKLKAAKDYRNQLIKNYPDFAEGHYLAALIYFIEKDFGKSIEEFNLVLKTNPAHLKALYNRALAFGLLEDYDTAISDLGKCIEMYPDYVMGYYSRGYWCELAGRFPEAIADYEKTISMDARNYDAYLGLAHIYHTQKDNAKACEALNRAITAGSQIAEELKENYCR